MRWIASRDGNAPRETATANLVEETNCADNDRKAHTNDESCPVPFLEGAILRLAPTVLGARRKWCVHVVNMVGEVEGGKLVRLKTGEVESRKQGSCEEACVRTKEEEEGKERRGCLI